MIEMCSGTSNYPWVTIWDIGMTYSGHFGENPKKCRNNLRNVFRDIKLPMGNDMDHWKDLFW